MKLCLNALVQLLDEWGHHYFSWDSVFDEDNEDDIEIEFENYLNDKTDLFDSVCELIQTESDDKIFKWTFSEAKKIIKDSKLAACFVNKYKI